MIYQKSFHSLIPSVIFLSFGKIQETISVHQIRARVFIFLPCFDCLTTVLNDDFSIAVLLSVAYVCLKSLRQVAETQINTRLPGDTRSSISLLPLEAKLVCAALSIFHPPIKCCNVMLKCPSNRPWQRMRGPSDFYIFIF